MEPIFFNSLNCFSFCLIISLICFVKSGMEPIFFNSLNCFFNKISACSPILFKIDSTSLICFVKLGMGPIFFKVDSKISNPLSKVLLNPSSSPKIIFSICACCVRSSGKASPIVEDKVETSLKRNGSCIFKFLPKRDARRKILLKTYPRPSLDGSAPSAIAKASARM